MYMYSAHSALCSVELWFWSINITPCCSCGGYMHFDLPHSYHGCLSGYIDVCQSQTQASEDTSWGNSERSWNHGVKQKNQNLPTDYICSHDGMKNTKYSWFIICIIQLYHNCIRIEWMSVSVKLCSTSPIICNLHVTMTTNNHSNQTFYCTCIISTNYYNKKQ